MVSVVYQKRAIPVYWQVLNKQGQSSFAAKKAVLRPMLTLVRRYHPVVLGDRELHRVALADWLRQQRVHFVLRLPKSTTVEPSGKAGFTRLDELPQLPGIAVYEVQVQVTQQQGFGRFNWVTRWQRVDRNHPANEVWYRFTNLESLEAALECDSKRFSIAPMFKDFKSGGYNREDTQLTGQRFWAIL